MVKLLEMNVGAMMSAEHTMTVAPILHAGAHPKQGVLLLRALQKRKDHVLIGAS